MSNTSCSRFDSTRPNKNEHGVNYIIIYTGYFYGGGVEVVDTIKLIQLDSICIFIYLEVLKNKPKPITS